MIEIEAYPSLGGMNKDDALENLPPNDYEEAVNLELPSGDNYLRKLKGTVDILSQDGNCFGYFEFNDFNLLFIVNNETHYIYKLFPDFTTELIFEHDLGIDPAIRIIDCKLIHNELLVINNGVDEPVKLNITMSRMSLWIKDFDTIDAFPTATITETDGHLSLTLSSGTFTEGTDALYLIGIAGTPILDVGYNSLLFNNTVDGTLDDTGSVFITNIRSTGIAEGREVRYNYVIDKNIQRAYDLRSTRDYLYINTPPLDPPTVEYISDASKHTNKINKQCFQFQAQFIYHDGTVSALSPKSDLLVDTNESEYLDNVNNGIAITVQHPTNYNRNAVKEVVFYVSKNEGDMYEFARKMLLPIKTSGGVYQVTPNDGIKETFYNDTTLIPVATEVRTSLFDRIPLKANGIEFIDSSRMVFSGVEKGMDTVTPNVLIEPVYNMVSAVTATDWAMGFFHDDNGDIFYSGYYHYLADGWTPYIPQVRQRLAINQNEKGAAISSTASGADVVNARSSTYRKKDANSTSTFVHMRFSSSQTIGTEYRVNLKADNLDATSGNWNSEIYSGSFTVICVNTDTFNGTDGVMDIIKDTIEGSTGSNVFNRVYGDSGDYVQTLVHFAQADAGSSTGYSFAGSGLEAPDQYCLEIESGLECVHIDPITSTPDASHFHWYQVDILTLTVNKRNTLASIQRSLKKNSVNPFAIRYSDHSGRLSAAIPIGELDLTSVKPNANLAPASIGAQFTLRHNHPADAVKMQFLFAGNKTYNDFLYAVVKTVADVGSFQEITLNLDDFNASQGTSLVYGFTEGDTIQRLQSFDSGTSTWTILEGDKTNEVRVISEDTGTITILPETSNKFEEGDLVVINTYKLDVEEDDELYFEIGRSYDIIDGELQGDHNRGDAIMASAFSQGTAGLDTAAFWNMDPVAFNLDETEIPFKYAKVGGKLVMHNSVYAGEYNIISVAAPSGGKYLVEIDLSVTDLTEINEIGGFIVNTGIYYSVGEAPRTVDTGEKYDGTIIKLNGIGDVYYKYRNIYDRFVEDYNMSDYFESPYWGKGRPSATDETGKEWLGSTTYYSEPYYNNTLLNGIATVFAGNFEEYDQGKGDIKRVMEHNGNLLLFHENKVGAATINKSIITTASGETIISKSDEVLGSVEQFHTYETGIGNQVYSLCRHGNSIYFGDNITKAFYRLAQNGIVPISEYKMKSWFNSLFNNSSTMLYCFVDTANNNLIAHSKRAIVAETVDRQIVFSEDRNRWVSFWDVTCQVMGMIKGVLASFENGKFAIHIGSNNSIHGSQLTSSLTKTFNQPKTVYKIWESIMLDPVFIDMTNDIDAEILIENEEGQESNLILEDFRRVGAGSWAGFLRDTTSDVDTPLINGDALRSKTLTLTLRSDTIGTSELGRIVLKYVNLEQKNP